MRTYKGTRGPHYDADATITVLELTFYILFPAKGIMSYRQIISSRLQFVLIKSSCLWNLFAR